MNNLPTSCGYYQTAAGILKITFSERTICEAVFVQEETISEAVQPVSSLQGAQLSLAGTEFQLKVWQETMKIPAGTTLTYQEIAQKIGSPKAARAVGLALGQNKIAYVIPCHRVIQKNGNLGGYAWGIAKKEALLRAEKSL